MVKWTYFKVSSPSSVFSAAEAIHTVPIAIPPDIHYCWVARGSVDSKLGQGCGNRTWYPLLSDPTLPLRHELHTRVKVRMHMPSMFLMIVKCCMWWSLHVDGMRGTSVIPRAPQPSPLITGLLVFLPANNSITTDIWDSFCRARNNL